MSSKKLIKHQKLSQKQLLIPMDSKDSNGLAEEVQSFLADNIKLAAETVKPSIDITKGSYEPTNALAKPVNEVSFLESEGTKRIKFSSSKFTHNTESQPDHVISSTPRNQEQASAILDADFVYELMENGNSKHRKTEDSEVSLRKIWWKKMIISLC